MPRIQTLFASAALESSSRLLTSRLKPGSELVVTLRQTGYGLPYSMLCYGVALSLSVCGPLFGLDVPWSVRAANWHFGLSVLLVGVFCAASLQPIVLNCWKDHQAWDDRLGCVTLSPSCFF